MKPCDVICVPQLTQGLDMVVRQSLTELFHEATHDQFFPWFLLESSFTTLPSI